ncbi:MAG: ACP S-malonyltransferase [Desulfoplanes sp.]|nr:ACP S-malonyltransferase [Desulfoplanes sp.]
MTATNLPTAILFPGQGSQCPGMGRDLAEHWSEAMELWERAEKISGFALREIYWDNDTEAMSQTACLQPALTVVNVSLWGFLKAKLSPVCCMAGHSLGEYAALYASGTLTINDTLSLVCRRGRLMAEAGKGTSGKMAAVLKLSQASVEQLVNEVHDALGQEIRVANFNTPAQFVISGTQDAINEAAARAKKAKGRAIILPVSGAFHSPMMAEAAAELARVMDKVDWHTPKTDLFLNATAEKANDPRMIKEVMKKQMTSSVYWIQLITAQWDLGVRRFLELGPKGILAKMTGQILKDHKDELESENIETLEQAMKM